MITINKLEKQKEKINDKINLLQKLPTFFKELEREKGISESQFKEDIKGINNIVFAFTYHISLLGFEKKDISIWLNKSRSNVYYYINMANNFIHVNDREFLKDLEYIKLKLK